MTKGKEEQVPVMNPFGAMDSAAREVFDRYCEVELAKIRLQQQQLDSEAAIQNDERMRADRDNEARLLVENAKAQAEADKISNNSALDQAKVDLEIRKLRLEGQKLENEAVVKVVAQIVDLTWPRIEQLGTAIARMNAERFELMREEMRLIAGRNPADGSKS